MDGSNRKVRIGLEVSLGCLGLLERFNLTKQGRMVDFQLFHDPPVGLAWIFYDRAHISLLKHLMLGCSNGFHQKRQTAKIFAKTNTVFISLSRHTVLIPVVVRGILMCATKENQ